MVMLNIAPCAFYPWGALTGAVPNIPEFYWDAVSQEERWKFLCINLDHMRDYLNSLNAFLTHTFSRIEFGKTDEVNIIANGYTDVEVAFTEDKTEIPRVVATLQCADSSNVMVNVTSVNEKSFTMRIINNSIQDTTASVSWIAYEMELNINA